MAGEAKQHSPIDVMGGKLKMGSDVGGGFMDDGIQGRKVPVAKGEGGPGQKGPIDPKGGALMRKGEGAGGVMK